MQLSVRTLRLWLAAAVVLLVAALAAYIAIGRLRAFNPLKGLPGKLGFNVEQESDNFTISHSHQGRTEYTIHASKEIQHKDGLITLKSVGMVLYGAKGDRNDRIHGEEFSYDPKNGVLRAIGLVFIDLAPPAKAASAGSSAAPPPAPVEDTKLIHVKTSGLVFLQKEEQASTDEPVEFATGGMTGHSIGASYDSGKGVLVLRSAVHVTGVRGNRPLVLTAARAELDRAGNIALLEQAKYLSTVDSGPESAAADHAVIHMDQDATPRHIDGNGHVALTGGGRGAVTGDHLQLDLDAKGQPREGHLFSNVGFVNNDPAHLGRGRADDAHVSFDLLGRPRHVLLTGTVDLDQKAGPNERRLRAATVDLMLAGGGKQPLVLVAGKALGAAAGTVDGPDRAWLRLVDSSAKVRDGEGATATDIRGRMLVGRFDASAPVTTLQGLDGTGQTELERVARDARGQTDSDDTSRGNTLKIDLGPAPASDAKGRLQLVRAEQRGAVETIRLAQPKPVPGKAASTAPDREQARADVEIYDGINDVATLSGSVELRDASSALFAEQARIDRQHGISTATGSVRVSYLDPNSQQPREPMHVVAAQAVSRQATGVTVFSGEGTGKARMWQGLSQVEAPQLELNRLCKTLYAHGGSGPVRPGDAPAVRTVLVNSAPAAKGTQPVQNARSGAGGQAQGSPVRVLSHELTYRDASREAVFTGHVRVEDADGTMLADEATAYLTSPASAGTPAAAGQEPALLGGGRLDHVVGVGHVTITQPERVGTGEKIVYTAADQTFVLTGTKAAMPKVVDEDRGMVTGAVLRFRSEDKVVFVEGDAANQRVRTETKLK